MTDSKFDSDPEALAWARAKIEKYIKQYRAWENNAHVQWEDAVKHGAPGPECSQLKDKMMTWRRLANMLHTNFIGGEGCVVASFDERLPHFINLTFKDYDDLKS